MKRSSALALSCIALLVMGIARADQPKPAADLLEAAKKEAGAKKKAIFVMFDASW